MHNVKPTQPLPARRIRFTTYNNDETAQGEQADQPATSLVILQSIYAMYGLIAGLLLLRFFFALFGAHPSTGLAHSIYTLTSPLVRPFIELLGNNTLIYKNARFEYDTLLAVITYGIIAWFIVRMLVTDNTDRPAKPYR